MGSSQSQGKSLWSTLCDLNLFDMDDSKWTPGKICRISVCTKDGRFWVEIFDEQVNNKILHSFALFPSSLIRAKDNSTIWSCVDYANNACEITLCASFKGNAEAEHCRAIFESIKKTDANLSDVNNEIM